MTIMTLRSRCAAGFLQAGWLLPAFFPVAMSIGRGMFNSALALYVVWALTAASSLRIRGERIFVALFGLLFVSYLLSLPLAHDPMRAVKTWAMSLGFASTGLITLAILHRDPDKLGTLIKALGLGGLLLLAVSYVELALLLAIKDYLVPRLDLRSVDLAFCTPFVIAWILGQHADRGLQPPAAYKYGLAAATLALFGLYIALSEERGSVVGFLVALAGLGIFVLRLRPPHLVLLMLLALTGAAVINGEALLRGLSTDADWFTRLDTFSSWRLTLWQQALQHPPEHILIGVGMGQAQFYPEVVGLNDISVRHLHNLWLDAWFETGFAGLGALLLLLGYGGYRGLRGWRQLAPDQAFQIGLFITAALAVTAQAQFSISYASREFGIQVFLCLAAILHLTRSRAQTTPGGMAAESSST